MIYLCLFEALTLMTSLSRLGNYDDENSSYIAVQHDHIAYRT